MTAQTQQPIELARIRRPFSVVEYERLAELGILDPDARVELIGGR